MPRKRRPPYRDGELALYYGPLERGDADDVVVQGGVGVDPRDRAFLIFAMRGARWKGPMYPGEQEHSILHELETRGYDLSTLRFSIQKKKPTPAEE